MLTGGITSGAEMLGITQPAVSRLVRDFELAVGIDLFERRGSGITPTADASLLLEEVERSFVGLGRIAEAAHAIRTQALGTLRIAAFPAIATSVLPRFVGRFLRERPNLAITIQALPSYLVAEAVAAGQADFGYAIGPLERSGYLLQKMPSWAVAILPQGHALARKKRLVPEDFRGERFIGLAPGTLFHSRVTTALAGIERLCLVEVSWSETACLLVSEGSGVSVVDPFSASEFASRGLVTRPFEPKIDFGVVSLRLPQRPLTPLAATFLGSFSEYSRAVGTTSLASSSEKLAGRSIASASQ